MGSKRITNYPIFFKELANVHYSIGLKIKIIHVITKKEFIKANILNK